MSASMRQDRWTPVGGGIYWRNQPQHCKEYGKITAKFPRRWWGDFRDLAAPDCSRLFKSIDRCPPLALACAQLLSDGRGRRPITATDQPIARESDRDLEALSTVYTVHGKVPSVSREDDVGFQVFSENNQCGVCEVHRAIRILHHELARAAEGRGACRHEHARVQEQFSWHAAATRGCTRDAPQQDQLRPSAPNR